MEYPIYVYSKYIIYRATTREHYSIFTLFHEKLEASSMFSIFYYFLNKIRVKTVTQHGSSNTNNI